MGDADQDIGGQNGGYVPAGYGWNDFQNVAARWVRQRGEDLDSVRRRMEYNVWLRTRGVSLAQIADAAKVAWVNSGIYQLDRDLRVILDNYGSLFPGSTFGTAHAAREFLDKLNIRSPDDLWRMINDAARDAPENAGTAKGVIMVGMLLVVYAFIQDL